MGIGSIAEISLEGVKVVIPKDFKHQIRIDAEGSRFEIVFSLPSGSRPVSLTCESKRVVDAEESVQVGAFFVDADFKGYKDNCGRCEYLNVCGGCRARAYAMTGDYLAGEPFCSHQPRR